MASAAPGTDATAAPAPAETIALCLSGGGLRATLFHFGLLKALAAHRREGRSGLSCVSDVYSVSGGSITAAHLVANWSDYNDPGHIGALEAKMVAFAGRNVRDRVLRRWILTRGPSAAADAAGAVLPFLRSLTGWLEGRGLGTRRVHWLQREYRALLGGGSIADCYRRSGVAPAGGDSINPPPAIHVLATSFTSGDLCSFSRDMFEVEASAPSRSEPPPGDGSMSPPASAAAVEHEADGGQIPLAFAVAASSAFPPLFPPARLTPRMLRNPADPYFAQDILLSDGGVFDNMGFEKFARAHARGAVPVSTLLVSNAGGSFKSGAGETYSSVISRNIRASDILMRRVGDATAGAARAMAALRRADGPGLMDVQIGDADRDDVLEPATQRSLRLVRTDLDAFEAPLARLLIDHGYRIASKQLRAAGWLPSPAAGWSTRGGSDEGLAAVAARGARRTTWRSFFFGLSDPWSLLLMWLIIFGSLAGGGVLISRANQAARAEAAVRKAADDRRAAELRSLSARASESDRQSATLAAANRALASGDVARARRILNVDLERTERVSREATAAAAVVAATPTVAVPSANPPVAAASPIPVTYAIPQTVARRDQQVFIQFAGALTRQQIVGLNRSLRAAGWRVQGPSGERIAAARNTNQVRYSGGNRAAAEELAVAINGTGIVKAEVRPVPFPQVGAGVLELWIALN